LGRGDKKELQRPEITIVTAGWGDLEQNLGGGGVGGLM